MLNANAIPNEIIIMVHVCSQSKPSTNGRTQSEFKQKVNDFRPCVQEEHAISYR